MKHTITTTVIGIGIALLMGCGQQKNTSPVPADAVVPEVSFSLRSLCGTAHGQEEAPVKVEAFLPITAGCQDAIGKWLLEAADKYPDVFVVTIYDMKSGEGRRRMTGYGIRCASVVINGSTRFDLPEPVGKVLLEGPMDPLDVYHAAMHVANSRIGDRAIEISPPEKASEELKGKRRKAGFE